MRRPTVSVIIPAYNAATTLAACLKGILDQDYPDFEIIVVDDASLDATSRVVPRHSRVRLLRNRTNLGPAAARNRAVAESRGDVLVFLDSDSIVEDRRWLANHAAAHASSEPTLVGGGVKGIGRGPFARADSYCHWVTNIPHGPRVVTTAATRRFWQVSRHLTTNNLSLRRSTFDLIGPLDEALRTGEDVDFCERALRLDIALRLEPGILVKHRDREHIADFLRCFLRAGRDRIPVRLKNRPLHGWILPRGMVSSILLAPLVILLLSLQTMLAWWPHDKRVALYSPLVLLAYTAMMTGVIQFFHERHPAHRGAAAARLRASRNL
jgi:glycosyltransferase involved in cell wall biosynthesis